MMTKETKDMTCPNCGYAWEYKGDLKHATCPSCYRKVKVE